MDYRERWELKDYLVGKLLERRLRLFHAGLFLMLLAFLLNFWYLQGVRGDEYLSLAENNRLRRIPLLATRGEIFDRNHQVIASTRPSLNLLMRRESPRDLLLQLRWLSPIIEIPYEELEDRLTKMRGRPLYEPLVIKEDIRLDELARIEARRERFPSVEVQELARRYYPHGPLFAHSVGFVGEVSLGQLSAEQEELRSGDIVGKSGIERTYDDAVRGNRGWELVSVNNLGRRMGESRKGVAPVHGAYLDSTLDLRLQQTLAEGLGEETGAGVFMDPWTGEVLALVSTPAFDPNLFADGISTDDWKAISQDPRRPMHDRAIASFHPPGSTFKVVMAAAGLEAGVVGPNDTVVCNGFAVHYGRRRLCWKRGGHGVVNLRKALAQSCNVYFYQLGRDLGVDRIHEYGQLFNLGRPTGIDIPGEEGGILPSREWKRRVQGEIWYPGDTISVAIGQGLLAATPLQMATAISVVATRGWRPTPHIHTSNAQDSLQVELSEASLDIIRTALADAVRMGTGRNAQLDKIGVAGKTGTAQVYASSAGVDSDDLPKAQRDHAWFVGYAPLDRPQIAFAVIVERGGHGGSAAAPIVRDVLEVFFAEPEPDTDDPGGEQQAQLGAD